MGTVEEAGILKPGIASDAKCSSKGRIGYVYM